jgi:hypothetical protein
MRRSPIDRTTPTRPKRSKPLVDEVGGPLQKELTAAAIASNRAQLHALEKILAEVKGIRTWVIAAVALAAISVVVGLVALFRGEALERRVQRLEDLILKEVRP